MNKRIIAAFLILFAAFFAEESQPITSKDEIFLYRAVEKVKPGHFPLNQKNLGSCVAFGHAAACDILLAIDTVNGRSSKFLPASPDSLYGGARNESYGRATNSYRAGSSGIAATRWLTEVGGVIYQQVYSNVDLSTYDVKRSADWGAFGNGGKGDGINGPFDSEAKKHPIRGVAKATTLEELDAALKAGMPVTICSGQGFTSVRDANGFAKASGSWSHCMVVIGKRQGGRVGYLILNSWGANWITGPKYKDQPDGSFYCEPSTMARILRAGDSWALSNAEGFKPSFLPLWMTTADGQAPAAVVTPTIKAAPFPSNPAPVQSNCVNGRCYAVPTRRFFR